MSGQKLQPVLPFAMRKVTSALASDISRLRRRRKHQVGKITRHRYVVHNMPVLAGTRIPTLAIWNLHHAGYRARQIIQEFPRLTQRDIRAAILYEKRFRRQAS